MRQPDPLWSAWHRKIHAGSLHPPKIQSIGAKIREEDGRHLQQAALLFQNQRYPLRGRHVAAGVQFQIAVARDLQPNRGHHLIQARETGHHPVQIFPRDPPRIIGNLLQLHANPIQFHDRH